jgi:DNA invertase Pin-like site-specific DNA recombinase
MKAAIYTRVSSRELQADGYSLDAQETACRRLAKERGWSVVEVFTDQESARTTDRPGFKRMLRQAKAGRFDVLIVHKLDRFSRSVADQTSAFGALVKADVGFISATEGKFDFSSPAGRLQMNVLGAVNEWYLDNLAAETSKGLKARAEAGMWLGQVPFGYEVNPKRDGGDGMAYPNEQEAEGVRLAFEKYATGMYSYRDVAELLNEEGYRPNGRGDRALRLFSKDTVNVMLTNRFYIGDVEYNGEHFQGLHEPIISTELFEQAQEARKARRNKRGTSAPSTSRVYPLTGIAKCARCGTPMRGSASSGRRYYRDPSRDQGRDCDQRLVRAKEAEDTLGDFLKGLTLPQTWQEETLKLLEEQTSGRREALLQKKRIEGQLERLRRLFVLGDLSEREYKAERNRLKARLVTLDPPKMFDLEKAAVLLQNFETLWDAATGRERKEISHTLLESVYLDSEHGPVVAIEPRAEFAPLFGVGGIMSPVDRPPVGPAGYIIILPPGAKLRWP